MTDLDRIDLALLTALQNDARASNKELAAKAGLAPSSTLGRVQRLRDAGILRGAHADVDGKALGIGLEALVFVRLVGHAQQLAEPFREHLLAQPEVGSYWSVGGDDDVLLHVRVRDSQHLHELLQTRVGSRPEVGRVRTEIIFEHVRKPVLPSYVGGDGARPGRRRP